MKFAALACLQAALVVDCFGSDAEADASQAVLTVPLQKQYVPISKGDKVVAYKTAYFGHVHIGDSAPWQNFTVVFDTGSGHLILPSTGCESETCTKHRRYDRSASTSAVDVEYDGTPIKPDAVERDQVSIAFGTGEVMGEFVREVVCLGKAPDGQPTAKGAETKGPLLTNCVELRTVLATKMTEDPFGLFAFDGVLGLGLEALTLAPEFSFFSQLSLAHPAVRPRFAVFLSRHDSGDSQISFGGHDPSRANSELTWAPVAKQELGYWQVQVKSVRVGDTVLEDCKDGSCRAILDTGTSLLGVPRQAARSMHKMLARHVPNQDQYDDVSKIDCRRVAGQQLTFELENGATVSLEVEDYSRPTPFNMTLPGGTTSKLFCRSLLLPVDMPSPLGPKVFIWGEPVLRRYYTIYDLASKQIGFTLAKHSEESFDIASGDGLPPAGSLVSGAPLPPLTPQPKIAVV